MENQPVIIIGMHRSGTSMLTRVLQEAGLFIGEYRDENDEARFFYNFNHWVLKQTNSSWDNPYNFKFINDTFKTHIKRVYLQRIDSVFAQRYLGWRKYIKYRSLNNIDFKWGWKDPRNTFVLEIYKEIYQNAKILHIYRNPIDVAQSLKIRSLGNEKYYKKSYKSHIKEVMLRGVPGYTDSYRIKHLDEGYKLWEAYIKQSLSYKEALHIKYEDLIVKPIQILKEIFNFIDISVNEKDYDIYAKEFNPNRAYSFLKNDELIDFYLKIKGNDLVKELGYADLI